MNADARIKEAERLLRKAGATIVRRTENHTIWSLNGYRTLTARHSNALSRQTLMLQLVRQFIRRARP
jgi:hypothetical protein